MRLRQRGVSPRLRTGRRRLRSAQSGGQERWWPGGPLGLRALVAGVAIGALVVLVATLPLDRDEIAADWPTFLALLGLTLGLTIVTVEMQAGTRVSVAGIGLLALGFQFGAGAAMLGAIVLAIAHGIRTRAEPARTVFNAGALALAAAAGAGAFGGLSSVGLNVLDDLIPAFLAGCVFWIVNAGLLVLTMAAADDEPVADVWGERFRWLTPHYLAFGPLALASTIALDVAGAAGLLAFLLPPALLMLSVRQYLERTRSVVEEIRQRNRDLSDLLEFTSGLSVRAHDERSLAAYAQEAIGRLAGTEAVVVTGADAPGGIALVDRRRPRRRAPLSSQARPSTARALGPAPRRDPPSARDRDRERRARRAGAEDAPRDDRGALALDGGEGLLHRRPHRARRRARRRARPAARLLGRRPRRDRDRRAPPRHRQDRHPRARSSTSRARSTRTSGR